MNIDESVLLAYVDGELDGPSRVQVETAMAHSAELQEQVRALRASSLPYGAAFEAEALPPPPVALQRHVDTLTAMLAATATPAPDSRQQRPFHSRRQGLRAGVALAASFAAGALLPWRLTGNPGAVAQAAQQPWVDAIASYHALYVRETVEQAEDSPLRLASLLAGFDERARRSLFIPDLSSAGYRFKRVQRLGYLDRPLVQMVYLPAQGRPAALCVLPAVSHPDAAPQASLLYGQTVISWSEGGLAQVFVTEQPKAAAWAVVAGLQSRAFMPLSV